MNCRGPGNPCYSQNGYCLRGCDSRFYGSKCEISCPSHCGSCTSKSDCQTCDSSYFGHNCSSICTDCFNMQCNQSGTCLNGCIKGRYGPYCLQNCPKGFADSDCNQQSGFCTRGCIQGYFGDSCTVPCPQTCINVTCAQNTGYCMSCENGKYGALCTLSCPNNCNWSDGCEITTGACKTGCIAGWYGRHLYY